MCVYPCCMYNLSMSFENMLLLITTLVVLWYTVETYKLRKESQKTNDLELKPLPAITFITTDAQTKLLDADFDINEKDILITNVGRAAALNVRFSEINIAQEKQKVLFRLIHSNILKPNETLPLAVTVPFEDSRDGRVRGSHPHPYLIPGMTVGDNGAEYDISPEKTYWKDYSYSFSVFYDNPAGDSFEAKFVVDKNGAHPKQVKKIV